MITQSHDQPARRWLTWLAVAVVVPVLTGVSGCQKTVAPESVASPSPLPSVTPPESSGRADQLAANVAAINALSENAVFTKPANDLVQLQQLLNHGGALLGTVHTLGAQKPRDCDRIGAVGKETVTTAVDAITLIQAIPREIDQLRKTLPTSIAREQQLVQQAQAIADELSPQHAASATDAQLGSLSTAKLVFELKASTARQAVTDIPKQLAELTPNLKFVLAAGQRAAELCKAR